MVKRVEFLDAIYGRARDVYRRDMEANLRAMRRAEGGYAFLHKHDQGATAASALEGGVGRDAAGAEYGDNPDNASQFPGFFTVENSIGGMKSVNTC